MSSPSEWSALLSRLRAAEAAHDAALEILSQAEERFFGLPRRSRKEPGPRWYQAACDAEARSGEAKDAIYRKTAGTPATTGSGHKVKVRLLAQAYGIRLDRPAAQGAQADDLVALLIRSLARDLRAL